MITAHCLISERAHTTLVIRGVRKTKIWFGFRFKITEPSKNVTSVQMAFRQKLRATCN